MFINFTNHPVKNWSDTQIAAAKWYGDIIDVSFPAVDPHSTCELVQAVACRCVEDIMKHTPNAVLCQGEFTLTFAVVNLLKAQGITVLAACSERVAAESMSNGVTTKSSKYRFVSFREF